MLIFLRFIRNLIPNEKIEKIEKTALISCKRFKFTEYLLLNNKKHLPLNHYQSMKNLRTIKSFAVAAFVFGTLSFATLTSCGNKATEETTEEAAPEEAAAELPAEHPAADTTATDTTAAQ